MTDLFDKHRPIAERFQRMMELGVNAVGINLNTVARAYRELTNAGLLASVRGRGTIVIATTERASGPKAGERRRVESGIAAALADAKLSGLSRSDIELMLARQVERLWTSV